MASKSLKPFQLEEDVSFTSFSKWQSTMLYCLNKEDEWKRFLKPLKPANKDTSWDKLTSDNPTRGLSNDSGSTGLDAETKVLHLNNMLEYIAQFVPVFLHHELSHECTDMRSLRNCIRQYYNLQESEVNFLKLATIKVGRSGEGAPRAFVPAHPVQPCRQPVILHWQPLHHNRVIPSADEDLSPTVERLAVLLWLELIDKRLPMLVARAFTTDLQTRTLKDL